MNWLPAPCEDGFTLTELLVTMAITGMIMGAIVSTFITQRQSYHRQEQVVAMIQNVRAAMDMMVREVRMAGYGVPTSHLSAWIDWVTGFTSKPYYIVPGGDPLPDVLTIASCFDAAKLSVAANQGDTTLTLALSASEVSRKFNTTTKKVVYIGRNESGVVTGISGRILTIDTDPLTPGLQGLRWSYPVDTPVELLKVVTYSISNNTLRRNENTGGGAQPLAENIEVLRVTASDNSLTLTLTGRTTNPDVRYTHPTKGDSYRRIVLSSRVKLRNLGL
jgi:prepilin-type N-terminal cleavage/methylation domain-containing protein